VVHILVITDFYSCETFHISRVGDKHILELISHINIFYEKIKNGTSLSLDIVFTGNECGIELEESEKILDFVGAEELYNNYIEERGIATMYKVTDKSIEHIKTHFDR
jgi:hypothetical protein